MRRILPYILGLAGLCTSACGPDNSQPQNQQQVIVPAQAPQAANPQISSFSVTIILDCKPLSTDESPSTPENLPSVANSIVLSESNGIKLTLWTQYRDKLALAATSDGDDSLTLSYTPGSTSQFLNRPVSDLSDVQTLGVHFANTLKAMNLQLGDHGITAFTVTINGIDVIHADLGTPTAGGDDSTYASVDVSSYFGGIEQAYIQAGGQ
jgi:hypothetical protein